MKLQEKMIFKFLLFIASVLSVTAGIWYYWNTYPEPICNRAGGFWTGVYGCDNYCDKTDKYCPDKLIFGCECGGNKCWDGKKCIRQ